MRDPVPQQKLAVAQQKLTSASRQSPLKFCWPPCLRLRIKGGGWSLKPYGLASVVDWVL